MSQQPSGRILIVDDTEANRYALGRVLSQAGFHVIQATSGAGALDRVRERPDLVILDVKLPDMDGYEVCRRIKSDPATADIPILHVSANFVTPEDQAHGMDNGAEGYLCQPVNPSMLAATVKSLIRARQAEHRVRDSEARFRQLANAVPQMVWVTRPDGYHEYYNRRWYEFTGVSEGSTDGQGWNGMFHPDDQPKAWARWRHSLASGEPYEIEYRLRHRSGEYRWTLGRAMPIRSASGEIERWFGTCTDIDDLKRTEEALRESERRLRLALEAAATGLWEWDVRSNAITWSPECYAIHGMAVGEFGGTEAAFDRLVHPDDRHSVWRAGRQAIERRTKYEHEFRIVRPDGAVRWVANLGRAVCDEHGTPTRIIGTITDVTERKRAEQELAAAKIAAENANRAKDRFLAVLSHELRTPLTPVVMSVAALEVEPGLPQKIREELAMIRRNIALETRLIDDLLDLSRVSSGKMALQLEQVGVHTLLNAATDILTSDIEGKGIHLVWRLEADRDEVNADAARLQQVFWNLLKNAVKFTPTGGTVTVRTWNEGPTRVAVEVSDTGKGIGPDVLPRVFNAFEQGEQGITRSFGGLGLGLAIAKAIVELHGGSICAESDGAGRGARFTVEMATTGQVKRLVNRVEQQAHGESQQALRVLLVEDHLDTLRTIRRLMEQMGFAVTAASTVEAALRLAAAHEFDVIVSDLGLPDATGLDLVRRIRAGGLSVPAVALTGYGMESDVRSTREAGFDAHLTKPVDISHLAAMVRRLANRQDATV